MTCLHIRYIHKVVFTDPHSVLFNRFLGVSFFIHIEELDCLRVALSQHSTHQQEDDSDDTFMFGNAAKWRLCKEPNDDQPGPAVK